MSEANPYKRVLVKLSGEVLAGSASAGLDPETVKKVASEVVLAAESGVQIALVIGGGNIFRGGLGESLGMDRVTGDHMGMLATVINSLALADSISSAGRNAVVMTSFAMETVAEYYTVRKASAHLADNSIVIVAGGTGNPYFTTDTAATLRAVELKCDLMMKATKVDGVYDKDPAKYSDAKKIDKISYIDVIQNNLRVMDLTAISLCMENMLPIRVFNLFRDNCINDALNGHAGGTDIL
ncbi:MAG: UMP kinase [Spirochaetes bacterium]|nr:UMP kinase [Spirochaetota bacterium]MBN2772259.1 UMP kinase [Spirochaetota bacterium]